jgi:sterol 14alpha-demethylase
MNTTNSAVWLTVAALVFITAIITKAARSRRTTFDPVRNRPPPPPVVNCVSFIGLLHTLYTKGLQAMIYEQYKKLGGVFTVSFLWWKLTFLVGPEVSSHFYQGLDSEVSVHMVAFSVPMVGKEVGYGVDAATRNEQTRFYSDALRPSKLRSHVGPMLQEVEVSYRIIICLSFVLFI